MDRKNTKINQFLCLLPYGFTSRYALSLLLSPCEYAWIDYSPALTMNERESVCANNAALGNRHISHLVNHGYLNEIWRSYGKSHWEEFRMLKLTQSGLNLLFGYEDLKTETNRLEACLDKGVSYRLANIDFSYIKQTTLAQRLRLAELSVQTERSKSETAELEQTLNQLLRDGAVSLLACDMKVVKDINLASQTMSHHQQYRAWRINNISTMFLANGFLTPLDRRPLWNDLGEESSAITDVLSATDSIRKKWFLKNPSSYLFRYPWLPKEKGYRISSASTLSWDKIPAFYDVTELPGFGSKTLSDYDINNGNAANVLRHNLMGVAIGLTDNYVCYHTTPVKTSWSESIENTTALAVQSAIDLDGENKKIMGSNRKTNKALLFCTTVHQFKAFFISEKNQQKKRGFLKAKPGSPYEFLSIVPINNSGVQQLRLLLGSNYSVAEESIINKLTNKNGGIPGAMKTTSALYQIAYNSKPVLVAYLMDFRKLFQAWQEYEEGKRFYIACYPEQAKFLRMIMPDAEFI